MLTMEFSSFWDIFAIPFGYVMQFFNWICGGHYWLSLLLFALVVKIVMIPLSIKQQKGMIKGALLRPQMALIEKKYAGRTDRPTLQKKQQEMMELQQKEGYSPLSGCLPLLIQFPILIGLYRIIRMPLKYSCGIADAMIFDIAGKAGLTGETVTSWDKVDQIRLVGEIRNNPSLLDGSGVGVEKLPDFTLFRHIDLSYAPDFQLADLGDNKWNYWLIAIPLLCCGLAFLTTFLSKKLNDNGLNAAQSSDQKSSMLIMNLMMPLLTLWIAFNASGALGLYWVYTSVLGIVQMIILAKAMPLPKYTDEEIKELLKQMKNQKNAPRTITGTSVDENGKPKSLHYVDDEDEY